MEITRRTAIAATLAAPAIVRAATTADTVVVGAGVFGAWTARALQLAGRRVTLIAVLVLLLIVELLNTGLEKLADVITRDHHPGIGWVKDMGSAAVFLLMINVLVIWIVILGARTGAW